MDIDKANKEATEKMMESRALLTGLGKARDVIPGMEDNLLLHAGPPITWDRASGPMRGAITGALIFEDKVKDEQEAQALIESGEFKLEPLITQTAHPNAEIRAVPCHCCNNGTAINAVGSICHNFAGSHYRIQNT